ncbi:hypothetical protein DA477_12425, partial [Levilactobacillus brevis]
EKKMQEKNEDREVCNEFLKTIADKLPSTPKQHDDVLIFGGGESLSLGIMNEDVVKYLKSELPDRVIDVDVSADNPDFEVFKECVHEYIKREINSDNDEMIKQFDSFEKWHIILDKTQSLNPEDPENPVPSPAVIMFCYK